MSLNTSRLYFLLLIDIKKSTKLAEASRKTIFRQLTEKLQELNQRLQPKPLLNLKISYGDEVAGLFEHPAHFHRIVCELREALFPEATFRFVAVKGRIGVPAPDIREIGGEVFKTADEQMKRLKKRDGFCSWQIKDETGNGTLTALSEMSNTLLERMTRYQREVYQLLAQGLSQKDIADKLQKYPQSVSNAVKQGAADQVISANKVLHRLLTQ